MNNNIKEVLWDIFIFTMITLAAMAMLSSCKTKYVSVPEYHTQYVVKGDTLWMKDSVLVHDSASVEIVGDTVKVFKYLSRDRYKYIYRNKVDTTIIRDSIPYVVPYKEVQVREANVKPLYFCVVLLVLVALYCFIRTKRNL